MAEWATLEAGIVPPNGMVSFTDADASNQPLQFYRVFLPP